MSALLAKLRNFHSKQRRCMFVLAMVALASTFLLVYEFDINQTSRKRVPSPYICGRPEDEPFADMCLYYRIADYVVPYNISTYELEKNLKISDNEIIYVKTDYLRSMHAFQRRNTRRYYLITGSSDISVPNDPDREQHRALLDDPNLVRWYGWNVVEKHERLTHIPIGLASSLPHMPNQTVVAKYARNSKRWMERSILLMVAFKVNNNPKARAPLMEQYCGDKSTFAYCHDPKLSKEAFLEKMGDTLFVLSPPGNGVDCIRHWESIILGAVPIIESGPLDRLFDGERVLIVDDLKNLNELYLLRQKEHFASIPVNLNKSRASADYWIDHFSKLR